MLTSTDVRPRPSYRPYRVLVRSVVRLSPSFVRVTFTGADLADFGTEGLDQRVKVLLPLPGIGYGDFVDDPEVLATGAWYTRWRALPAQQQNPIRTYTIRAVRPHLSEVDVDFVTHGDTGPATAWVRRAQVGDQIVLVGPDAGSPDSRVGIEFNPGSATTLLLAGDETAVPAVSAILESLPEGTVAHAILEIPRAEDCLQLRLGSGITVDWLPRGAAPAGSRLDPAVRGWLAEHLSAGARAVAIEELSDIDVDSALLWETPSEAPTGSLYAWLAGEAAVIKSLRRFLVRDCELDRRQVAFMGYWREGKSELS
ncbi:MAG: siderophore-interacting protein [Naasia sp.]|jgi:NADPH-dependent ferric siderophore reductase|uniref:siderophore-interacting protein n=1 Tax=Naasia sp. TaxID=2546198 RepID=UPI00260B6756|nr:siderophore-interacting protein [Naasia sp.]MCU1569547.1 siderophore-interacting protein [Naasia sp.]